MSAAMVYGRKSVRGWLIPQEEHTPIGRPSALGRALVEAVILVVVDVDGAGVVSPTVLPAQDRAGNVGVQAPEVSHVLCTVAVVLVLPHIRTHSAEGPLPSHWLGGGARGAYGRWKRRSCARASARKGEQLVGVRASAEAVPQPDAVPIVRRSTGYVQALLRVRLPLDGSGSASWNDEELVRVVVMLPAMPKSDWTPIPFGAAQHIQAHVRVRREADRPRPAGGDLKLHVRVVRGTAPELQPVPSVRGAVWDVRAHRGMRSRLDQAPADVNLVQPHQLQRGTCRCRGCSFACRALSMPDRDWHQAEYQRSRRAGGRDQNRRGPREPPARSRRLRTPHQALLSGTLQVAAAERRLNLSASLVANRRQHLREPCAQHCFCSAVVHR
mmetsp:Transcript_24425/g.72870  ORF Transcript_24425/g.72870 Transcript_24425/m.72870 type:complete len:384 (-) Transcript_24425:45-1196(-)